MAEVLTVVSNLALLVAAVTAWRWRRILGFLILFTETFASGLYHLCDSFDICLFNFSFHHHLDFFFAQSLIVYAALYFIQFEFGYKWLHWVLMFIGMVAIAILQATLPAELMVQAAIAIIAFAVVVGYWVLFKVPEYNWWYVLTGVALLSGSVILFAVQTVYNPLYWGIHSLWHIAAGLGIHFIIMMKPPAYWFEAAASKIGDPIIKGQWSLYA